MGKKPWETFQTPNHVDLDTVVEEKKPWENYAKKKGLTISEAGSESGSTPTGSEGSNAQPSQPSKPSEKNTAGDTFTEKFLGSALETAYSTFKHVLPQTLNYLHESENFNPRQTYEEKLAKDYEGQAANEGISRADANALKEYGLNKRKQLVGEKGIALERILHERKIGEKKVAELTEHKRHETEMAKELEGIPRTYRDVKDIESGIKYAGGLVGQAVASFPLILTGGAAEGAEAYYEGVDETAKQLSKESGHEVTPEDVVSHRLDKEAQKYALGVNFINGALDVAGFETILGASFKKQIAKQAGKELAKKGLVSKLGGLAKPALGEALTETAQEFNTFVASRLAAGKSKDEIKEEMKTEYPRFIDAALGGLAGGLALGGGLTSLSAKETVEKAQDDIKSTGDQKSIDDHAEKIVEAIKQAPEEGVQNDSTSGQREVPSEVGKGKEPVQAEPVESTGAQEAGGSGVVQEPSTGSESTQEKINQSIPLKIESVDINNPPSELKNFISKQKELSELLDKNQNEKVDPQVIKDKIKERDFFRKKLEIGTEKIFLLPLDENAYGKNGQKKVVGTIEQEIDISKIAPSQETVSKYYVPSKEYKLPDLVKKGDKYIVSDGHNRIAIDILNGKKKIKANVEFTNKKDYNNALNEYKPTGETTEKAIHEPVQPPEEKPTEPTGEKPIQPSEEKNKPVEGERVFVYGTLEDRNTRKKALGLKEDVEVQPASAKGNVTDEGGYPDFHPEGKNTVEGEVLTLTPEEIKKLDKWEIKYDRKEITLDNGENAWVYEEKPKEEAKTGKYAILQRIDKSDASPQIKQGIKEKGDTYIPKNISVSESEAQNLVDLYGHDKSELIVKDQSNGVKEDARVILAGKLYESYSKDGQIEKAVDLAMWSANHFVELGRAVNAGKFWAMITKTGPEAIETAIIKENQKIYEGITAPMKESIQVSKDSFEEEVRRIVEERVQQQVGKRLEKAKLISQERRKEIGSFFDKLKVKTNRNIATATVLPIGVLPHVWNAAIDVIKTAVLTGADVANAIQAGIDYIKKNQKEQFNEEEFRKQLTPELEKLTRPEIKKSEINESKIKTPNISGKRKRDFINQVIEAYNKAELTDERFEKLYASKIGYKELTDADRQKIRTLAKAISEAEKFDEELSKIPLDEFTHDKLEKSRELNRLAKEANRQIQEFAQKPHDIADTFIAMMQAGVMSTMSLISNVFYNVANMPIRLFSLGTASMIDYGISKLAKIGLLKKASSDRTVDMIAVQKGYFQGLWNGTLEGIKQLRTGQEASEKNLREIQSSFNPQRALKRWADEGRTTEQKVNDYIEGTIGWPAEVVFRLLNLGDKPFKKATETARALELGELKGLKGRELERFMKFPDEQSKQDIMNAGQEATFQQNTAVNQTIQNFLTRMLNYLGGIPYVGKPAKVLAKSQILFVKTPLNLLTNSFKVILPIPTIAVGIHQMAKGNRREGAILVGNGMAGLVLYAVARDLFMKGLLTGDDDDDKKKRDFQMGFVPPPNSMNISAIERGVITGEWNVRPDDIWVSYSKMGTIGVALDVHSNTFKNKVANNVPLKGSEQTFFIDMAESFPKTFSSTLDQSFLTQTNAAFDAFKTGDEQKLNNWLIKTTESFGAVFYPNIIASTVKASDEFLRDTKDDTFAGQLKNVYKAKIGLGDELPPKVNLWGDKVKGNPEGRNKYAFYLFDPSKFREVDTNDFRFKLYQLFKKDYDADWLPSMPTRNITVNREKIKLTPAQYAQFCIYVGQERSALTSSYMNSLTNESDEQIKKNLRRIYDLGYENGKIKFETVNSMNVSMGERIKNLKSNMMPRMDFKVKPKF